MTCEHPRQAIPWRKDRALACAWPECTKGTYLQVYRFPEPTWYRSSEEPVSATVPFKTVLFVRRCLVDRQKGWDVWEWEREEDR